MSFYAKAELVRTKMIILDVSLLASPGKLREAVVGSQLLRSDALRSHITTQLTQHGDPLRWAITSIDQANQTARVEAVVTTIQE
ncbi:MAG: hypothetical protein WBA76_02540 [Phormidesmis sp.]